MAKKSEMNRLQRMRSRRNRRGRTPEKDKMKTPPRKKKGIRKPRKTNRRRTKRRRTKRSMNEGKGEAGVVWPWQRNKTRVSEQGKTPQSKVTAMASQVTATADPNEVMLTLKEEKGEKYKNNLVNELLILLENNNAENDEEKRLLLALESCKKREKLKIEYMEKFNRLREALREINVFNEEETTSVKEPIFPPDVVKKIREILSEISENDALNVPDE